MWKTDYLKALGLPTEQVDAIKDASLIKDVPVFYVEGSRLSKGVGSCI